MKEKASQEEFYQWFNLSVGLTSLCNLRCKMCPVVTREPHSLTREQALHIADFADRRGFKEMVVGGGEPTLLPYLGEFLDRLSQTKIQVGLLTNAVKLNDELIRQLAGYPRLIVHISIDGVGEVHDNIRGKGTFAAADKSLRLLLDAGCRVAVNCVVQRTNFSKMLDVYEYFKQYPLEWNGYNYAEPSHGKELVPRESIHESIEVLAEICRRSKAEDDRVTLSEEMLRNFALTLKYPRLKMHPGKGCTIPQRLVAIDEMGYVVPCWHYLSWRRTDQQNLNHRSLDDIVDAPERREEVLRVIGPHGCVGCSTTCYFWDEDFRLKTMEPKGMLRARRAAQHAKEYLRLRHPWMFNALKKAAAPLHR